MTTTSTVAGTNGKTQAGITPPPTGPFKTRRQFRFGRKGWFALGAGLLVLILIITWINVNRSRAGAPVVTQPVAQQTLVQTVSASGTVNSQNMTTVGSQVSGTISALYVDFNSKVKKGQVLAKIDPSTFQAQLDQAQAALAQSQAQAASQQGSANAAQAQIISQTQAARASSAAIATASANVAKARSALQLAQTTLSRDQSLLSQGYIARSQIQTDQDNVVQAQSALQGAQASLAQTRAQAAQSSAQINVSQGQSTQASNAALAQRAAVQSAAAQVQQDELNVAHTIITSPVDGTVINRAISIGQTVAAGFEAPTLFTIAQDLHKMEVDIAVGEPDVGSVKPGQHVTFTVLAYPNTTFNGIVTQVRDNPTTTNNVVTYTVVTQVNNSSGKLLPGMTATALIQVATARNALVVPTAALQWRPSRTGMRSGAQAGPQATGRQGTAGPNASPWGQSGSSSAAIVAGATGTIFVKRADGNRGLIPVPVHIDLVNATQAAVTPLNGATLAVGDPVVIGSEVSNSASAAPQSNGPRRPRGIL